MSLPTQWRAKSVYVLSPYSQSTSSKATTGTANASHEIVAQNASRKYLRITHADSTNSDTVVRYMTNGAADADGFPLGGFGSYWEFTIPTCSVQVFCSVANVKLVVEEGF